MPPAMPGVPITAQVDPFTLTIKEPIHNKKLASISLDTGLSFKMSDDLLFDPNG